MNILLIAALSVVSVSLETGDVRYRAAAMGVYLCGAFLIGCPATAVLGYVGQHFSYQHGIAMFGGTYALGAIAVLVARLAFFDRDKQFSDPPLRNGAKI